MAGFYEKYEEIKKLPVDSKNNPDDVRRYYAELSKNRPFILYGAGAALMCLYEHYSKLGIKISGIADTYKRGSIFNHMILSPNELKEYKNACILITSEKYEDKIKELLISLGFSEEQILPYIGAEVRRIVGEPIEAFESKYLEGYKWAYDFFADAVSKNIVLEYLKMFLKGGRLTKTTDNPQYFDEFPLNDYECFVQAGCFNGDTVKEFVSKHKTRHDIYTFEAEPQSYCISKSNLEGINHVSLIPKGLWSSETMLVFSNVSKLGGTSFVMEGGVEEASASVPVVSIDGFFKEQASKPTFIQLDIEGSEREALMGSEEIIRKYKPKLAVCVYHLIDDIYVIPQLIHRFCPEYKMHLQQHNNRYTETVLYATI